MNTRDPTAATTSAEPASHTFREVMPAAAFVVLWSTGYIAGKVAIEYAAPFTALTVRFGGAALLFALLLLFRPAQWPTGRALLHSAVVGALSLAMQFGGVYGAFALGASSGFAALVIGSMPLATSLTSAMLGSRQPASHWFGLLIGFSGVLLVLQDRLGSGLGSTAAGIALFIGLCGITFGTLYQKRYALGGDLNSSLLVQNLTATALLAPFAVLHEHLRISASTAFVASMLWLILINSGGTFALLFVLLRRGAATRVSTLFYLVTPVTAVMGWALMHEPISPIKLIGFGLAAGGVYLGTRPASQRPVEAQGRVEPRSAVTYSNRSTLARCPR